MSFYKFISYCVLVFCLPSLILPSSVHANIIEHSCSEKSFTLTNGFFDRVLNLLDQIENGSIEESCSLEEIEKINDFLITLARQGNIFNADNSLERDIQLLLHDILPFEYSFF